MQRHRIFAIPIAALLALALGAPMASAQDRHPRDRGDHAAQQRESRDGSRRAAPAARQAAPDHAVRRDEAGRRAPEYRSRAYIAPRAVPRDGDRYRSDDHDRDWYRYRDDDRDRYRSNVWVAPRAEIVTPRFYLGLGGPRAGFSFGLFVGRRAPYRWLAAPRYVYGYGGYAYAPRPGMAFGAVSLDFGPDDAAVYVDGAYAGRVEEFQGAAHPLALVPGRHRIDIAAPGYEPMAFYVDVAPGELIPYQGGLRPLGY